MGNSGTKRPAKTASMIGAGPKVIGVHAAAGNITTTEQRRLFQCKKCGHQASLTAGTLFRRSKIKLRKWFLLIYLMIRLGKKLNLTRLQYHANFGSSRTIWGMKRKIEGELAHRKNARHLRKLVDA